MRARQQSSRPQWSGKGNINEQLKQASETKGQFGSKNDLIKWLRTWVGSGLGRLYPEAQQMKGSSCMAMGLRAS